MNSSPESNDGPFGEWIDDDPSENTRLLASSMHETLNERDLSAIDDYHSPDLRYFRSSDEPGGRKDLKRDAEMFLQAFPDLHATIPEAFADDEDPNTVTMRYTIEGTQSDMFDTIPPTNRAIEAQGVGIAEFDGEDIVEFSLVFDNLGTMQDLGILP